MNYSFIKIKQKSIFSPLFKIWFILSLFTVFCVFGFYIFFIFKNHFIDLQIENKEQNISQLQNKLSLEENKIISLNKQNELNVLVNNLAIKDSLINLDKLVNKNKIILNELNILENSLELKGFVKDKDIFLIEIEKSLKKIFKEGNTIFKNLNEGFDFISVYKDYIG